MGQLSLGGTIRFLALYGAWISCLTPALFGSSAPYPYGGLVIGALYVGWRLWTERGDPRLTYRDDRAVRRIMRTGRASGTFELDEIARRRLAHGLRVSPSTRFDRPVGLLIALCFVGLPILGAARSTWWLLVTLAPAAALVVDLSGSPRHGDRRRRLDRLTAAMARAGLDDSDDTDDGHGTYAPHGYSDGR